MALTLLFNKKMALTLLFFWPAPKETKKKPTEKMSIAKPICDQF